MSDKIRELKMQELKDMFFYTFGIVPLQNYGVVGDGMTDNRLKIQQAIYDAIEVGAKYIFVPKGNYYYSNELFKVNEVAFIGNSIDTYIKDVEIKQFPGFNEQPNNQEIYSNEEQVIGKWIDGKTLYRKVVDLGFLGNASGGTYNTGLDSNICTIVRYEGYAVKDMQKLKLPFFDNDFNKYISFYCNDASYAVSKTNWDASEYNFFAILEYIKTTD